MIIEYSRDRAGRHNAGISGGTRVGDGREDRCSYRFPPAHLYILVTLGIVARLLTVQKTQQPWTSVSQ